MSIINAVMVPHPPLIIPEVGCGEENGIRATVGAYAVAAQFIMRERLDTIVVLSPHSMMYYDYFHISPGTSARGDFSQFQAGNVSVSAKYDETFVQELAREAENEGFPAGTQGERSRALDHATMVPLWFLQRAIGGAQLPPIVRIGLSGKPLTDHYRLGMLISRIAEKLGRRVSVVASGDLSHRLKPDGAYGFKPEGPLYDRRIMDVMGRGAFGELFLFGDAFCESAGECGHRSFTILAGCLDGQDVQAKTLSYEGPFGVGYGICTFSPGCTNPDRRFLDMEVRRENEERMKRMANEDEYVRLARLSVETYVRTGKRAQIPADTARELLDTRAGVFVSLHIGGVLRGCIGTTEATAESVAREILQNGISACSRDPRFSPVTMEELPLLSYSVDMLGKAEDIQSPDELDVKRYGVIVSCGTRRGLLLPDLDGVDTVDEQISIARKKANIGPGEKVQLQRFEVMRHV